MVATVDSSNRRLCSFIQGKIILLGIISKECPAETSSKSGRHANYDDEIASLPLSVKPALGTVTAPGSLRIVPLLLSEELEGRSGNLSGFIFIMK
ncbi:hypothetical protein PoB_006957600 [Plakobranchus ocellatus]|uniref:Uncharacterized protein n=1 Tax=Plakobranchus ocellatus TaxID=259542 RepID=A0AAV4DFX3_9GAST|nr:hypothetical protein PoB_006957600 [Plakobranchus ocellatus]